MCSRYILPLMALLLPWAGRAQGGGGAENPKFSAHANLVFLPTRVENRRGETIYGLKPEQFIVEDNGVRQPVQMDEDPESRGLSLVVVVQCSRSAPAEFAKLKGLPAMIDAITGDAPHEVAVMSYGEGPYVLGEFSGNSDAVGQAISRLKSCGEFHAASIDAVYFAIHLLKGRPTHYRRAILLISETRDHGSRSKLHEVAAELGITDTARELAALSGESLCNSPREKTSTSACSTSRTKFTITTCFAFNPPIQPSDSIRCACVLTGIRMRLCKRAGATGPASSKRALSET